MLKRKRGRRQGVGVANRPSGGVTRPKPNIEEWRRTKRKKSPRFGNGCAGGWLEMNRRTTHAARMRAAVKSDCSARILRL